MKLQKIFVDDLGVQVDVIAKILENCLKHQTFGVTLNILMELRLGISTVCQFSF